MFCKYQRCMTHAQRLPRLLEKGGNHVLAGHRSITDLITSEPGTIGQVEEVSKPYANQPFVKDLFLGKYNTKILVFPEVTRTEELDVLKSKVEPVERFFKDEVDSRSIDETGQIPAEILARIKELGLFGKQVETHLGGMALDSKGYALMNEVIGVDGSISTVLSAHQDLALHTILLYGSEEQREKYMSDLAQGKKIAAYCVAEKDCGSDMSSMKAHAMGSYDGTTFTLNGTKTWVTNGTIADVFIVFVKAEIENIGSGEQVVSAFIVDRSAGGITTSEPTPKLGVKAAQACDVKFENTVVPAGNLIKEIGSGIQIALSVMSNARLSEGAAITGALKHIIGLAAEHVINRKQFQKPLTEFGMIQDKFARMGLMTYVLESMTYLTAGTNDRYQNPETSLESAVVKVYATETAWACSQLGMEVFGAAGCLDDNPVQRHLRDAYTKSTFNGTNDMLRLYIALHGLQHCGQVMSETIRKTSNPLTNVGWTLKQMATSLWDNPSNPKATFKLYDHVHPNVSFAGEELEKRVHQFRYSVEFCMSVYGQDVLNEQPTLRKLADVAIDLYGITAVLARASRAMSIGLKNADHEILLAQSFTREASDRIGKIYEILREGKYDNGDEQRRVLAEKMFKARGYAATHPLERNW